MNSYTSLILVIIAIFIIGISLIIHFSSDRHSGTGEYHRNFCEESCEGMNTTLTEIRTTYGTSVECICVVSEPE